MANVAEKQALGLPSDASEEQVLKAIGKLAEDAKQREEAEARANAAMKSAAERNPSTAPPVPVRHGIIDPDRMPGEGEVRTRFGIEKTVKKRVKVLSCFWYVLEPSPIIPGNFLEVEHRAIRNQVVAIPESTVKRYSEPDIDAFYRHIDPEIEFSEPGHYEFAKMSEADLINWHRATKPAANTVVEASDGDPDVARRLIAAETTATGGDPREEVVSALAEVIARGNA